MIGKVIVVLTIVILVSVVVYDELPLRDLSLGSNVNYGVSVHNMTSLSAGYVYELGASWIRIDYSQNSPIFAQAVQNAETYGFNVLAILDHWSVPEDFTYQQWNLTVRSAVVSYPYITAWEVWNEPDLPTSYYGMVNGSALQYFTLLKYTYNDIKSLAPNDIVIGLGGYTIPTNETQIAWLLQLKSYGAFNYMNAISLHLSEPYTENQLFSTTENDTIVTNFYLLAQSFINSVKTVTSLPIWITEAGAGFDQSYYINTMYPMFIKEGITHIFWYDLINDNSGLTPNYGLLSQNNIVLTVKPSFYALQNFIRTNK